MPETQLTDRARLAEDDYFRRRDAELLEKARSAARVQPVDDMLREERRALGEAIGLHHLDVIVPLHAAGLRAGNSELLEWLPAVEVAWIDNVDTQEREELQRRFSEANHSGAAAADLLREWLRIRPSDEAIMAARRALHHRLDVSDPDTRRDILMRVMARCEAVGRASGGLFGLAALSRNERSGIDNIREDLG